MPRFMDRHEFEKITAAGLALGKGFTFRKGGALRLKGFDEPIGTYELAWSDAT